MVGLLLPSLTSRLFPECIDHSYDGSRVALYFFRVLAVVSTVRACIHLLAPDGGANSIAGLVLGDGARNTVFAFSLWGLSQLLFALIELLVAFRWRSLVPLMYVFVLLEILGRMLIGVMKPPVVSRLVPGGVANWVLLPVIVIMLVLSLRERVTE